MFDASGNSGQYSISFNGKDLVDTVGNAVDTSAANTILARDLCASGFCSYENAYVGLVSASANPSSQLVNPGTGTSNAANITFTLVFSQPVTLTQSDPSSIFSLTFYEALAGDQVGNAINLNDTFPNLANVDDDGNGYAYTYTLSVEDDDVSDDYLWALYNYDNLFTAATDTELNLLLLDSVVEANSGFNFLNAFHSAQDVYPAIPATIQSEFAASADPSSSVGVYFLDGIPEVDGAEAVAANSSNSQSYQYNSDVKRHVAFTFSGFNASTGDGFGMHMLFRTTDAAFTQDDPSTAPYYGAEGGIFISGQQLDQNNVGYHICPPFSKHLDRIGTGMQYAGTPTYNENRMKIHYLAIPYDAVSASHLYSDDEIKNLAPTTIDFTGALANTEPCVRTTFYNDGVGQYGYIVDSDQEEQHMVIANAMLQDTHGDTADLAMLPVDQLDNVYFDLYSKDYTADSWRRDQRITAKDLTAQITADNLNNSSLHKTDDGIAFQVDTSKLSIFASRFVNSINARFLDSVFLDDLTLADIPAHSIDWKVKHADLLSHSAFDNVSASNKEANNYSNIYAEDDYFTPNYRNQTPDALVDENDNRLVLSIGVHPSAISVDPDGGGFFSPFESNQANFLKMDPAFYGLYYGGVANTTEPGFDYTSRHLAYINFDLVYELDIDPDTQEITGATLAHIVSPFTLLRHSFFSVEELEARQLGGETYSAVAASIADNVFRHNFTGTSSGSSVQHFLPFGVYCYQPIIDTTSSCYNADAQMLLPDPNDSANGYSRTVASQHNLHRGVMYFNDINNYSASISTYDSLNDPALLERFMRLHHTADTSANEDRINTTYNPAAPGAIGTNAYTSMLYNSFDRDHAYDYTYNASTEDFASTYSRDASYSSSPYEQEYWGVSPFAESPDARADQILPNAFFMGAQSGSYYHTFINHPYQYSSFVQKIHPTLADADDLIDKNIFPRGLDYFINSSNDDISWNPSFDTYASFIFPNDADVLDDGRIYMAQSSVSSSTYMDYGDHEFDDYAEMYSRHIISTSPHTHEYINYFDPYDNNAYEQHIVRKMHYPSYYSGRNIGYLVRDTYYANNRTYALSENFFARGMTNNGFDNAFFYRSDQGSRLSNNRNFGITYQSYSSADGESHYAALNTDFFYTPGATNNGTSNNNIQRMFLPHHEDDFDFDRGQIMANKLGFFVDTGVIMDYYDISTNNDEQGGHAYSRLFFPSDPAAITSETSSMSPIASTPPSLNAGNKVANYYPLVLANESLHTTSGTWPVLLTEYSGHTAHRSYADLSSTTAARLDGISGSVSNDKFPLNMTDNRYQRAVFPIALDKIFPENYRYQLGFVNREELFMYDATAGNGDTSSDPTISRFYASAVGNFGYATQYSRLNRRSMQGYHLSTSSQFLGDHLARFSSTPAAGIHTPSELTDVFGHTPVEQGATGTNYGSYAEGYYNLTTTGGSETGGNWRSVSYTGTLRGYVLELRTHPIEQHYFDEKTDVYWEDMPGRKVSGGDYFTTGVLDNPVTTMQNLTGGIHPEGDF